MQRRKSLQRRTPLRKSSKLRKKVDGKGSLPAKRLKQLGKKGLQWQRIRKELKERFRKAGITRCEICGSNFALGFAHRKKRACCDEEELYKVALLCNDPCHREADSHGAQHMFDTINAIIAGRAIQP
jgi:hypothetical protein